MAAPCNNSYPWLALDYGENQVFCDVVSDTRTRIVRSIPDLKNRSVLLFKPDKPAGWFITKSTDHSDPVQLSLWNAVTQESIDLPLLDQKSVDSIQFAELTEAPDHPDCMVLMFVGRAILFCHVHNDYSSCWTRRDYSELEEVTQFDSPENKSGYRDFDGVVVCDAKNIFMIGEAVDFMFMKIEIVKPKTMLITRLPCKHPPLYCFSGDHRILEDINWVACSSGDFFSIVVSFGGAGHLREDNRYGQEIIRVTVFKLDFSDMSWNIVRSCPNVSFFVTPCNVFLTFSDSSTEAGNRVYILTERSEFLYTYHIQENTIRKTPYTYLFGPCSTPPQPYWVLLSKPFPREALSSSAETSTESSLCWLNADHGRNGGGDNRKNHLVKLPLKFTDLPPDMLDTIYSHLDNPMDYLNFRASNKVCRSLVSPKGWRSMSIDINVDSPWLIIPSLVDSGVSSVVDPVSNSKHNLNLSTCWDDGSIICYSSNGWLLIKYLDGFSKTFGKGLRLYNPMTKSTICIPETPLEISDYDDHYFFATPPHDFHVFGINISNYKIPTLCFTELGKDDKEWYQEVVGLSSDYDRVCVNQSNINPVVIDGVHFYFLRGHDILAAFICTEEGYVFKDHHFTLPCSSSCEQRFLVGCNAAVLSIYIGNEWLRVFQWDDTGMVWQEKEELDNYNIYLSSGSCIMKEAEFPVKGNRVYLPRFHQGCVVYYSLITRKFHAGEGDSSVVSYYETKEQLQSCWFEPSWNCKPFTKYIKGCKK